MELGFALGRARARIRDGRQVGGVGDRHELRGGRLRAELEDRGEHLELRA